MERAEALSGIELRSMLIAGTSWLEKIVADINALNVYPVPDGDCGTNMLFTMRASLTEAAGLTNGASASAVAEAIARGALMGARGNSGVILSQIWRGLFEGLKSKEIIEAHSLAHALKEASVVAYRALSNPVEGTILTVMRDIASAAGEEADGTDASPISVMEAVVDAARASVINTPNLLQVLKDAGVVDAGGHGLFTLLEGAFLHLKGSTDGRSPELLTAGLPMVAQQSSFSSSEEESYGFCTQFMIKGDNLNLAELKNYLEGMGKSVIVVGDKKTIRVHIHTQNPDEVTKVASSYGELVDIDINDMDEQHIEFLILHEEKMSKLGTAIIAVVNGDGMINTFSDLGVSAIIPGGQTMNPSTMDILQTVEKVIANNIILLPNNKNVIPTANLIQPLTTKKLKIISTETIPQGISALIAFIPEDDFESNVEEMTEAMTKVKTIEITHATRTTTINNIDIKKGEIIGLLDNELLVAGNNSEYCVFQLLKRIDMKDASIVTIYYGKDAEETEAKKISSNITELYTELEVGVVNGGQPYYEYIISVE